MILVLGGTVDAVPICNQLSALGHEVLLSNLTTDLNVGLLRCEVEVRTGALDDAILVDLIGGRDITTIVDATHPYAEKIKKLAFDVSNKMKVPLIRFERKITDFSGYDILWAATHQVASDMASSFSGTAFLSIGSRNLAFYNKLKAVARIFDSERSIGDALTSGICPTMLLPLRGPFTVEQNIEQFRKFNVTVLVTKDSGEKGNIYEKLNAAKIFGIPTIVIQRPQLLPYQKIIYSYHQLREVIL